MQPKTIAAACRGAMPGLPTRIAASVRALADWIADYAETPDVDTAWLTELYEETIGWLLGAWNDPASVPERARGVDLGPIPVGQAHAAATALLRRRVRRELLHEARGSASQLRVVWDAAARGGDEVATLDTHEARVRRLDRAIRECDEALQRRGMIEAGTASADARPPRLARLLHAMPDRVRSDVVGLASELGQHLRAWRGVLLSRPAEHARVWQRALEHLHEQHCTIGMLRALAKSPTMPMIEGCQLETGLNLVTARRLARADVRRALQQLAVQIQTEAGSELVRVASMRLGVVWSSQSLDAPRPAQITMGSKLNRYRLWLPRLTVDDVRERAARQDKTKEMVAAFIDEERGWHEGRARAFREDGSVDVAYTGGEESVADERGKLPAGIEVGGAAVSCPTTSKKKIVAALDKGVWREGRLVGCAEAAVVQFNGSETRRPQTSARYIEWLRIPAESVAKGHVFVIPHEEKMYARDLVGEGMHETADMSRPEYELALKLDDDFLETERDRAVSIDEAKEDAKEQIDDAAVFVRRLEEEVDSWRERIYIPRGPVVEERALVASSRRAIVRSVFTAEQLVDIGALLDYADSEIAGMRAQLGDGRELLEALQTPGLGPRERKKLHALAASDELRDRTARIGRLLEECLQRLWDVMTTGVEHALPEHADIKRLTRDLPRGPKQAVRRLMQQQRDMLSAAYDTARLRRIEGPARADFTTGRPLLTAGDVKARRRLERQRQRESNAWQRTRILGGEHGAPGSVDASKHQPATAAEVSLFSSLGEEHFAGARVTVRFNLPDGGSAWYDGAVDNLRADGSLDVYYEYTPDPELDYVPLEEVEEGNVRWARWTEPMAMHALYNLGSVTKICEMIALSFQQGGAQYETLIKKTLAIGVDASTHQPATEDEVRLFAELDGEDVKGARVTVQIKMPEPDTRSAWFACAVHNMKPDGSLQVSYDHTPEQSLADVPIAEIHAGNVCWSRWTQPMCIRAMETFGMLLKIRNMISLSFTEGSDESEAVIQAALVIKAAREEAALTIARAEAAKRTRPRRRIEDDDDEPSVEREDALRRALDALLVRAGNDDEDVRQSLAELRTRVATLAGPGRATLEALATKIEKENGYVRLDFGRRNARKR